jgi:hypothetical protein
MGKDMKTLLYILISFCGFCFPDFVQAASIDAEIEIDKDNLATVQEYQYIKKLHPNEIDNINNAIAAKNQGKEFYYRNWVWLDEGDKAIAAARIITPNSASVSLTEAAAGHFVGTIGKPGKYYFSIEELAVVCPLGEYQLVVTFADGSTDIWTTTVPDYNSTPFPDSVSGSLAANAQRELLVNWNAVAGFSEYEVWASDCITSEYLYRSGNLQEVLPQAAATTLEKVYAGNGDYLAGVQLENDISHGDFRVELNSETTWFSFKYALILNAINKVTINAGKKPLTDRISFSGPLDATEADLLIADGNDIVVTIDANDMDKPVEFRFPINSATFKKGKYKYTHKENASRSSFKLDTKKGKMQFNANKVDLTGLACPISITITIGKYTAVFEANEAVVNGPKKPCPLQLIQSIKNTLVVTKSSLKRGKTPATDFLTVSGTFTVASDYSSSNPLVVTLGSQTFSVPGTQMFSKNGVQSCRTASTEGPIVMAKLDYNKCTFRILVRNATIDQNTNLAFGINCFDINLQGLATIKQ